MKRKTYYNVIQIALIYYQLIGDVYDVDNPLQRDLARNNFKREKNAKKLHKETLYKALDIYSQKIREDFE